MAARASRSMSSFGILLLFEGGIILFVASVRVRAPDSARCSRNSVARRIAAFIPTVHSSCSCALLLSLLLLP